MSERILVESYVVEKGAPGEHDGGGSAAAEHAAEHAAERASIPGAPPTERLRDRARARAGRADLLVFRVASELFALDLASVEEAIDCPAPHPLPEMPAGMRGVFTLRDALVALWAPDTLLGVPASEGTTTLVFRAASAASGGRRVALMVDDVDDVFVLDLAQMRETPGGELADGILLGVARRGPDLVGVLDAEALLAACRSETVLENV